MSYDAGFAVDPNEKEQYDPSAVPSWLEKAARLQARLGLNDQPFLTDDDDKATVKQVEDMLAHVVASKTRGWMESLDPPWCPPDILTFKRCEPASPGQQ